MPPASSLTRLARPPDEGRAPARPGVLPLPGRGRATSWRAGRRIPRTDPPAGGTGMTLPARSYAAGDGQWGRSPTLPAPRGRP